MLLSISLRNNACRLCYRNCSNTVKSKMKLKPVVVPDETTIEDIIKEKYKPRKHPGIVKVKTVIIPDTFVKAAINVLEDFPVKALIEAGQTLSRHLKGRVPPMEQEELKETVAKIQERILKKHKNVVLNNEEEEKRFYQMIKDKTTNVLREKVYNWQPVKYDEYTSLAYLLGRFAPEYAVLAKIFWEIANQDPGFKPHSLFDFGSGTGTATWAANLYWKKHIYEYFNVDISRDMNDLAQILLQGGKGTGVPLIKGTFYRQFLPASNVAYDLVISAYSLLELPSLETRLEVVLNLWNKTHKYLVIVEHGTNAGFKVINEVRDFILQIESKSNEGHVFSPCPHDNMCPRYVLDDGTPCNFEVSHYSLPIRKTSEVYRERYSYVVLKKGKRPDDDKKWPRIVRNTLVRSKHSICRICTASGKLDEVIFSAKKHGKMTYHCARSSKWGDLLPITLEGSQSIHNSEKHDDEEVLE